jgi:hypothetical protein
MSDFDGIIIIITNNNKCNEQTNNNNNYVLVLIKVALKLMSIELHMQNVKFKIIQKIIGSKTHNFILCVGLQMLQHPIARKWNVSVNVTK